MSGTPRLEPDRPPAPLPDGVAPRPTGIEIVAFLCELFAFGTLALWGFLAYDFPWNVVVGLGAPLAAIALWALFVSPKAVLAVHPLVRAVVELLVYVSATAAWWSLGQPWIGLAFGVVAVTVGLIGGRRRLA